MPSKTTVKYKFIPPALYKSDTYSVQKYYSKTYAKYLQGETRPLWFLSPVLKKGVCFITSVTVRLSAGEDIQLLGLIDKLKNTNSLATTVITDHLLRSLTLLIY